jgi:hypothetical protein
MSGWGRGTYSDFSFDAVVDLFKQPNLDSDMLLEEFEDEILHVGIAVTKRTGQGDLRWGEPSLSVICLT